MVVYKFKKKNVVAFLGCKNFTLTIQLHTHLVGIINMRLGIGDVGIVRGGKSNS